MAYELYGDGVRDDRPAIQEMLDSGAPLVELPSPRSCYRLSGALKLNSNVIFSF